VSSKTICFVIKYKLDLSTSIKEVSGYHWRSNILSLKNQRFEPSCSKDLGNLKLEFMTKLISLGIIPFTF